MTPQPNAFPPRAIPLKQRLAAETFHAWSTAFPDDKTTQKQIVKGEILYNPFLNPDLQNVSFQTGPDAHYRVDLATWTWKTEDQPARSNVGVLEVTFNTWNNFLDMKPDWVTLTITINMASLGVQHQQQIKLESPKFEAVKDTPGFDHGYAKRLKAGKPEDRRAGSLIPQANPTSHFFTHRINCTPSITTVHICESGDHAFTSGPTGPVFLPEQNSKQRDRRCDPLVEHGCDSYHTVAPKQQSRKSHCGTLKKQSLNHRVVYLSAFFFAAQYARILAACSLRCLAVNFRFLRFFSGAAFFA